MSTLLLKLCMLWCQNRQSVCWYLNWHIFLSPKYVFCCMKKADIFWRGEIFISKIFLKSFSIFNIPKKIHFRKLYWWGETSHKSDFIILCVCGCGEIQSHETCGINKNKQKKNLMMNTFFFNILRHLSFSVYIWIEVT